MSFDLFGEFLFYFIVAVCVFVLTFFISLVSRNRYCKCLGIMYTLAAFGLIPTFYFPYEPYSLQKLVVLVCVIWSSTIVFTSLIWWRYVSR